MITTERKRQQIQFENHDEAPFRAKQSFKDQCDINRILDRAKRTGVVSHLQRHQGTFGDFRNFDFEDAQFKLAHANSIFYDLGAEVRKEFGNSPAKFFKFASDPANAEKLAQIPELARPGRQFPDVMGNQLTADALAKAIETGFKAATAEAPKPERSPEPDTGKPAPPKEKTTTG